MPSRDGKKLFAVGGAPLGEVVRYDATSRQFQPFLSGISAIQLSFSKDGQWVTYMGYPEGILWRSKLDGTERVQLISLPMTALAPQWSPDGKEIAFSAQVPGKPLHIYIISADGGNLREVSKEDRDDIFPNWSPDGSALIFGNIPVPGLPGAIYRLDLKTAEVTKLKGSEGTWYPSLSPDGNSVAVLSEAHHILVLDPKAERASELTKMSSNHPAWSRDGKYVYFDSTDQGEPALYRVLVKEHKVERVVSLKETSNFAKLGNVDRSGSGWLAAGFARYQHLRDLFVRLAGALAVALTQALSAKTRQVPSVQVVVRELTHRIMATRQ